MKTLKWGVLSTAKIGLDQVIPAMQESAHTQIQAIASRTEGRARQAADRLGIPASYGSYEALLADPDIDAIYNPLPNHMHLEWTIKAMDAGKHVLCEKPLGLRAEDVQIIQAAAAKNPAVKVTEAFMYRHHPQWAFVMEKVQSGLIGSVKMVQSHFTYFNSDEHDIRNIAEYGGGGLLDIGCYCVSSSRGIFGREPERVMSVQKRDPVSGVDTVTSGILDFGDGVASFNCGTLSNRWQGLVITGTEGCIEVPFPFNPPHDKKAQVHVFAHGDSYTHELEVCNHYALQAEAFARMVSNGEPPVLSLDESLANMKVLDKLSDSARYW